MSKKAEFYTKTGYRNPHFFHHSGCERVFERQVFG